MDLSHIFSPVPVELQNCILSAPVVLCTGHAICAALVDPDSVANFSCDVLPDAASDLDTSVCFGYVEFEHGDMLFVKYVQCRHEVV